MQWSPDKNAGFSRTNPQRLYLPVIVDPTYHYESVNVEAQQSNPYSLLWWTKRLIALRKRYKAFSRGTLEFLHPENYRVLAFLRHYDGETLLVVANLSRFVQPVELDLSALDGTTPVELFGRNRFPAIQAGSPYPLTLGPHAFYWFSLQKEPSLLGTGRDPAPAETAAPLAGLTVAGGWASVLDGPARAELGAAVADLLPTRRWFGGKARPIRSVTVSSVIPLASGGASEATPEAGRSGPGSSLALVTVEYTDGEPEVYALPLAFTSDSAQAERLARLTPPVAIAWVEAADGRRLLYEPVGEPWFWSGLLRVIGGQQRFRGDRGEVVGWPTAVLAEKGGDEGSPEPALLKAEQSNTSVRFGDRFVLKLFRRLESGVNPDLEIGLFLTEKTTYRCSPRVAGGLEVRITRGEEPLTLGILQELVPNEGDAWGFTLDALGRYFDRVRTDWGQGDHQMAPVPAEPLLDLAARQPGDEVAERIGTYLPLVRLLGERTAELHIAMASAGPEVKDFTPEPFSELYQRSLYESMRSLTRKNFRLLRQTLASLPDDVRADAEAVLAAEDQVIQSFQRVASPKMPAERIRVHGDFHLGQVLYTGKDFVILDFEGEPTRSLTDRRLKRSPLRDVAGMLRSFQYAAYARLLEEQAAGGVPAEEMARFQSWAFYWERWVSAAYLQAYLDRLGTSSLVPSSREHLPLLLDAYVLEKAVYELSYELNNRPGWVRIPLQGIRQILGGTEPAGGRGGE
jgi:maltose alpha-D-glucosyltransferase/alpha-amylase